MYLQGTYLDYRYLLYIIFTKYFFLHQKGKGTLTDCFVLIFYSNVDVNKVLTVYGRHIYKKEFLL